MTSEQTSGQLDEVKGQLEFGKLTGSVEQAEADGGHGVEDETIRNRTLRQDGEDDADGGLHSQHQRTPQPVVRRDCGGLLVRANLL